MTRGQPEGGDAERRAVRQINHHAGLYRPRGLGADQHSAVIFLNRRGQQLCGRGATLVHHQDHRDRRLQQRGPRGPDHLHLPALQHLGVDGDAERQQGVKHVVELMQVASAVPAEVQHQHPHAPSQQPGQGAAHVAAGAFNELVQPDVAHAAVQQIGSEDGGHEDRGPGHRDHQRIGHAWALEGHRHRCPRRTADHPRDLIHGQPAGGHVVDLHDAIKLMDPRSLRGATGDYRPHIEPVIFRQEHDADAGKPRLAALTLPPFGVLLGVEETGV